MPPASALPLLGAHNLRAILRIPVRRFLQQKNKLIREVILKQLAFADPHPPGGRDQF